MVLKEAKGLLLKSIQTASKAFKQMAFQINKL
ncbi:MAG: hypothetical protein RIR64_1462 [Bacteroidota bacterium]|jgi:hypothetical protein